MYKDWNGNVLVITDTSRREIHIRFVGDILHRITVDYGEDGLSYAAGQTVTRLLRERSVAARIRHTEEHPTLGWDSTPEEYPVAPQED